MSAGSLNICRYHNAPGDPVNRLLTGCQYGSPGYHEIGFLGAAGRGVVATQVQQGVGDDPGKLWPVRVRGVGEVAVGAQRNKVTAEGVYSRILDADLDRRVDAVLRLVHRPHTAVGRPAITGVHGNRPR